MRRYTIIFESKAKGPTNMYTQCTLQKQNKKTTTWLPSKFAKIDKILDIKENEVWDNGWTVIEVGSSQPDHLILSNERQYKNHRRQTDI